MLKIFKKVMVGYLGLILIIIGGTIFAYRDLLSPEYLSWEGIAVVLDYSGAEDELPAEDLSDWGADTIPPPSENIPFSARTAARQQRLDMPPNPPVTNFQL